jgi:hypothetical protein
MERSRSSRTSRAPRSLPRAERNCQPGRRANCSRQGSGLSIRAAERLLASCGSPASKRSWVRTSLLLWIVGAAPAGRALRDSSERPGRADRTHALAQEDASAPIGGRTTGFNRKEAWSAGRTARSPSPKRERPSPVRQVPIRAKVQHLAARGSGSLRREPSPKLRPKLVSTMSRFKTRVSYGTRFRRWSQGWRPDVP